MSVNNPFMNEGFLDVSASLNKMNMVEIPGVQYSRRLAGLSAHNALSSEAVAALVRSEFCEAAACSRNQAIGLLHSYLRDGNSATRARALAVCEGIARNLGCLLLILTRQNVNRSAARLDWNDDQWRWWKTIERIVIGGGVLAADVGEAVFGYIKELYIDNGLLDVGLELSDCAEYMPLAGVANIMRSKKKNGCLLDFGHTSCKSAAMTSDGKLLFFEKAAIGEEVSYGEGSYNKELAARLDRRITEIACRALDEAEALFGAGLPSDMVVSIANYYDGRRFAPRGGYAKLNLISNNYRQYLQKTLQVQTGKVTEIEFVHDCTAAARSVKSGLDKKTAVIVLGTGLGAGFCESEKLL